MFYVVTLHRTKSNSVSCSAVLKEKLEAANKVILKEFELERSHHQKLVKEHARLQQRLENLQVTTVT